MVVEVIAVYVMVQALTPMAMNVPPVTGVDIAIVAMEVERLNAHHVAAEAFINAIPV